MKKHDIDVISKAATGAQEANSNAGENDKITSYYGNNSKTTTLAASSTHVKVITEAISFFFKDIQPYSVVEAAGFKNLVKTLEPRYTIPDRAAFTDTQIPALYNKVKIEITELLSNAERVALAVDCWMSCTTHSYITVTAHHIDKEWETQNVFLQTRVFHDAHRGINLAELLHDVCQEWKMH